VCNSCISSYFHVEVEANTPESLAHGDECVSPPLSPRSIPRTPPTPHRTKPKLVLQAATVGSDSEDCPTKPPRRKKTPKPSQSENGNPEVQLRNREDDHSRERATSKPLRGTVMALKDNLFAKFNAENNPPLNRPIARPRISIIQKKSTDSSASQSEVKTPSAETSSVIKKMNVVYDVPEDAVVSAEEVDTALENTTVDKSELNPRLIGSELSDSVPECMNETDPVFKEKSKCQSEISNPSTDNHYEEIWAVNNQDVPAEQPKLIVQRSLDELTPPKLIRRPSEPPPPPPPMGTPPLSRAATSKKPTRPPPPILTTNRPPVLPSERPMSPCRLPGSPLPSIPTLTEASQTLTPCRQPGSPLPSLPTTADTTKACTDTDGIYSDPECSSLHEVPPLSTLATEATRASLTTCLPEITIDSPRESSTVFFSVLTILSDLFIF